MLNIGEMFENYRIVRLLSRRETGNLYQAVDMVGLTSYGLGQVGRPVGIQIFPWSFSGDERSIIRMWREAAPLYKLEHPIICRIFRVAHFQDKVFLVTDLLEGRSLDYVIGGKPPAYDIVISYALQIASALQAAHGIGILHLGLNPENIFVTSLGLKLLDFGISIPIRTVFPGREEELKLAFAGSSAGGTGLTFCTHVSPEQAAGMPVDARSDLFSLGAVLYEVATGVPAFGSNTANIAAERLLQKSPASPKKVNPDIPAALEAIILKAILREREERYQSAAQMIQDLLAIADVQHLIALRELSTAEHLLLDQLASDPENSSVERTLREVGEQIRRVRKSGYMRQLCWQAEEAANSKRYAEAIEVYARIIKVAPSGHKLDSSTSQSQGDEGRAWTIRDIIARIDHLRSIANIKELPAWIEPGSRDDPALKRCTFHKNDKLQRYTIVRILHSGAEADLYEAQDTLTGQRVAVETLSVDPDKKPEVTIRDGPDLLYRLTHPNLCAVHEVGKYNGFPYVIEDYLEGGYSLESVIDLGEMSPVRKLEVIRQVCSGLEYAHRNGLTGLDIDPTMVMLQADGQVKLIGYWITRPQLLPGQRSGSQRLGRRDKYRPPEEWKGTRSLANVNVWAVGVMLYRLFSYRHPFSGLDADELAANIENQPLKPLADQLTFCPPGLDGVLAKSLAKDPQYRYKSAETMATDLQSVITSLEGDRVGLQSHQAEQPYSETIETRTQATEKTNLPEVKTKGVEPVVPSAATSEPQSPQTATPLTDRSTLHEKELTGLRPASPPTSVSEPLARRTAPSWRWAAAAAVAVAIAIGISYLIMQRSASDLPDAIAARGTQRVPTQPSHDVPLGGKNYALLFATDEYQYWPHLNNPLSDAHTIADELRDNYGYSEILPQVVANPKTNQIVDMLHDYAKKSYGSSDQLFIYFAGHGFFDEQEKQGFIVGADSKLQRDDTAHSSYLDFSRLSTMLDNIPIQHIFVVLDVCYGGAFDLRVTKWAGQRGDEYADVAPEKFIRRKLAIKGRLYLTSGEITSVPDGRAGQHSPFARRFIASLRTYGGKKQLVTATSLALDVGKIEPEPRFGDFGDSAPGADFLFVPK